MAATRAAVSMAAPSQVAPVVVEEYREQEVVGRGMGIREGDGDGNRSGGKTTWA